jgi:hypothetical protein
MDDRALWTRAVAREAMALVDIGRDGDRVPKPEAPSNLPNAKAISKSCGRPGHVAEAIDAAHVLNAKSLPER